MPLNIKAIPVYTVESNINCVHNRLEEEISSTESYMDQLLKDEQKYYSRYGKEAEPPIFRDFYNDKMHSLVYLHSLHNLFNELVDRDSNQPDELKNWAIEWMESAVGDQTLLGTSMVISTLTEILQDQAKQAYQANQAKRAKKS